MHVAVVGSGPSGLAAAKTLLDAGHRVDVLDVGIEMGAEAENLSERLRERIGRGLPVESELWRELKDGPNAGAPRGLIDGLTTLVGGGVEADRMVKRIQGSAFAYDAIDEGIPIADRVIPRSLAKGGLSNVWGAACYTLRDVDYREWPFGESELAPYYARAAEMLGVVQHEDDLARAYPLHGHVEPDAARNPGSAAERLVNRWRKHGEKLAERGFAGGRARLAVRPRGERDDECRACGLCFYGCAFDSIFSARRTLKELIERDGFAYRPGRLVLDFREEGERVVVRSRKTEDGAIENAEYDALFLGAGVLSSLRIAADSQKHHDRPTPLQDTDMTLLPVLLWGQRVPGRFETAFTLGEVVLTVDPGVVSKDGIHIQFYSFHEYFLAELERPLRMLPAFLQRLAAAVLNNFLIAFVYTSGRESVRATARIQPGSPIGRVEIDTEPHAEHDSIRRNLIRCLWRARKQLGFVPIPPLMKATPIGFSGHLAGTLPMRRDPGPLETSPEGLLSGTRRVHVVDSAVYPDMPAQNLTLTTVANSIRIADAFLRNAGHSP